MRDLIMQAIRDKRVVRIRYDDFDRVIEPHAFGINKKGRYILRAYQADGGSKSFSPVDWKLFLIDKVQSIALTETFFPGPRYGYKRGDPAIARIAAEL